MTRTPYRLSDIGDVLPWPDLRDFINHLPPVRECALYRSLYPKSWWWETSFDFQAAQLNALQWANWQRGGGKGEKPKPIRRPKDYKVKSQSAADVETKRLRVKQAVRQRRAVKRVD